MIVSLGSDASERQAADEGANKSVPACLDRHRVGKKREAEHRELSEGGCAPSPSPGRVQQRRTDESDGQADTRADEEVNSGTSDTVGVADFFGDRARDEEVDKGGRDAVVQSAFDVQYATDAARYPLVLHDRRAERSVGGCNDRADKGRDPEVDASEQRGRGRGARRDRQRKADPEETEWESKIGLQRTNVDVRSVTEEHERERDLRDGSKCRRADSGIQQRKRFVRNEKPQRDERDRCADVDAFQPIRDQTPEHEAAGDDRERAGIEAVFHDAPTPTGVPSRSASVPRE